MSDPALAQSTVIVVDDDLSVRRGVGNLLRSVGYNVEVFESGTAALAAESLREANCLILDVKLPGLDGLDVQTELLKRGIHAPVIFLTGHGDIPMSVKAIKRGALEFLTKPVESGQLIKSVEEAIADDLARREHQVRIDELQLKAASLTARERQVMEGVTAGLMNKQIADRLNLSEIMVKVHRGNVMRKMGAESLAELVRMAETLKSLGGDT